MTADELRYEVFELLYEKHVNGKEKPTMFVGIQGENVVVLQPGGENMAVVVIPAKVGVLNQYSGQEVKVTENNPRPEPSSQVRGRIERLRDVAARFDRPLADIDL